MLTYRLREHVFKVNNSAAFTFPNISEIRFHLKPLHPFGLSHGGGKTAWQNTKISVEYDGHTGKHEVCSKELTRIKIIREIHHGMEYELTGNIINLRGRFNTQDDLNNAIVVFYFVFPSLLNLSFADPPYIEKVDGKVGDEYFEWILKDRIISTKSSNADQQAVYIKEAIMRLNNLIGPQSKRFDAAITYFHTACRLNRIFDTPGEFVSEVILNLYKVLAALFPAKESETMNTVRQELTKLGFTPEEIERDYIPAIALRNHIDVGHIQLGAFQSADLAIIHNYAERAEWAFRALFFRLIPKMQTGEYQIPEYQEEIKSGKNVLKVIENLRKYMKNDEKDDQ